MSTKKLSLKYLKRRNKMEITKTVMLLGDRINTVRYKIKISKKRINRKKRELKRSKLRPTRQKKLDSNIIDFKNNFRSMNRLQKKLQTKLDNENNKLINLRKQIRDIRKHGQTNTSNFYNTLKDDDDELDSGKFIIIAENNITLYENEPIFNVIADASKDKSPFIIKSYTTINNGEPREINRIYRNVNQLTTSIKKWLKNTMRPEKFYFQEK